MLFWRSRYTKTLLLLAFGTVTLLLLILSKKPTRYINETRIITDPVLDQTDPKTEDQIIVEIQKGASNLPVEFWMQNRYFGLRLNNTCARLPQLLDLQFNNINWQTLVTSNGTFQLLNAYFDDREYNKPGPTVRLIAMINKIDPEVTTYCQIWFETLHPIIIKSQNYSYIWRKEWRQYKEGEYEAYLISCEIPKNYDKEIPVAVSLVEKECDNASNLLRVIYNKPEVKKDFAVCVKGLNYPYIDLSVKLVEWVELLDLLGADMIYFYEFSVHPNISRLLEYYKEQGKIQVTPFQLAGDQPNLPALRSYYFKHKIQRKRVNEIVPYNDCFYQHMYEYKYIVLLDIDEVIIPHNVTSWKELLAEIHHNIKEEKSSYSAQNLYFLDSINHKHGWYPDIPKYMHMLQHVYRSVNFTRGQYVKSFFNTEEVLILHNHYPISCFNVCRNYDIEFKYAQLQHYRNDCVSELSKQCLNIIDNSVMDTNIWKFKEPLIRKVHETLSNVGFL